MIISLRFKILITIVLLLLLSLLSSLFLSVDLFKKDKRAYIFESQAALASALRSQIEAEWKGKLQLFNYLSSSYFDNLSLSGVQSVNNRQNLQSIIAADDEIGLLKVSKVENKQISQQSNLDFLDRSRLALYLDGENKVNEVIQDFNKRLSTMKLSQGELVLFPVIPGKPLIGVMGYFAAANVKDMGLLLSAVIVPKRQFDAFQRAENFNPALMLNDGSLLVSAEGSQSGSFKPSSEIYKKIINTQSGNGVGEFRQADGQDVIYAFNRLFGERFILVTQISAASAYQASQILIEKNILATIFIIAMAAMVGIIFSRRLTDSLRQLYQATLRFAQGDFNTNLSIRSKDEVGVLAGSFQTMAGEIVRLLALSAEKARMEQELATAQLVQRNFFPPSEIRLPKGELAGFHQPASECGGDWWGYFAEGSKLYVCIGDATGHGVPAALITASVKSAFETLLLDRVGLEELDLHPNLVLSKLNQIVFSAGAQDVKMSFFVAEIDVETGKVRYSNAAHNFPMICKFSSDKELSDKEKMIVLKKRPDPHLGDEREAVYNLHDDKMNPGDVLFFYTDGLIECQNVQGEMYGKKRLIKKLASFAGKDAFNIKQEIVEDAMGFFGDQPMADDVTFVVFRMN